MNNADLPLMDAREALLYLKGTYDATEGDDERAWRAVVALTRERDTLRDALDAAIAEARRADATSSAPSGAIVYRRDDLSPGIAIDLDDTDVIVAIYADDVADREVSYYVAKRVVRMNGREVRAVPFWHGAVADAAPFRAVVSLTFACPDPACRTRFLRFPHAVGDVFRCPTCCVPVRVVSMDGGYEAAPDAGPTEAP